MENIEEVLKELKLLRSDLMRAAYGIGRVLEKHKEQSEEDGQ